MLHSTVDDHRKHRSQPAAAITPCDDCRHARRCASERLGCQALVIYQRVSQVPVRWAYAPRLPSGDLYEQAMRPVIKKPAPRPRTSEADSEFEFEVACDLEIAFADDDEW